MDELQLRIHDPVDFTILEKHEIQFEKLIVKIDSGKPILANQKTTYDII